MFLLNSNCSSRLLVRHPNVMNRLRKEIVSVMGNQEQPSRQQIRRMPYLARVVKESLSKPLGCFQFLLD